MVEPSWGGEVACGVILVLPEGEGGSNPLEFQPAVYQICSPLIPKLDSVRGGGFRSRSGVLALAKGR